MENLISIIVPVYNSEEFLKNCFSSILNQTYKNYEVLIICDKSSDNSYEICKEFANLKKNFKLFYRDNAKGVSSARNFGLDNISNESKYVCFIDADDYVDKNFLSVLVNNIITYNADVSICAYKRTKSFNKKANMKNGKIVLLDKLQVCKKMFLMNNISGFCWNKLFKISILKNIRFNENISYSEDTLFVYEYLINCNKAVFTEEPLYFYYFNKKSAVNIKFSNKRLSSLNSLQTIQNSAKSISQTIKTYASAWYFLMALEILFYLTTAKQKQKDIIEKVKNILRKNYTFYKAAKKDFSGLSKFGGVGANLLVQDLNKKVV